MWKAFKFVFGAVLGYFFAIAFIFAMIIGVMIVVAMNQPHQQPYHATKATRS
jgi:hypothetical protein